MYGFNKYKVITLSFIFIFVLLVWAMYSTTKTVALRQEQEQQQQEELQRQSMKTVKRTNADGHSEISIEDNNIQDQLNNLRTQFDFLTRDVENIKANQSQLRCRVQGLYNNGTIDETTPDVAFREARANAQDIVLVCSF